MLSRQQFEGSRMSGFRARRRNDQRNDGRNDEGMTTAEYAVGTVAACAFAAVLYKVVTSATVSSLLTHIVQSALHAL